MNPTSFGSRTGMTSIVHSFRTPGYFSVICAAVRSLMANNRRPRSLKYAKIFLPTGQDMNLEQVTRGFAWHYKAYEREQSVNDRKLYDFAEKEVRAARRGLWADAEPVPPSEFRHIKR